VGTYRKASTRDKEVGMCTEAGTRGKKVGMCTEVGTRGKAGAGPKWAAFAHACAVATGESASGLACLPDHLPPA
jgi:hypothetical protein